MKSAILTDLDSRGSTPRSSPGSPDFNSPLGVRPSGREIAQDTLAAVVVSSVIVLLAYLYWAA
ncbi:MAG: hypothetical protein AB7O66_12410 [Limisphaerales bacterium]